MTRLEGPDGYWVSDDPDLLQINRVHRWLSEESYWAKGRPLDTTERAIAASLNLGLYGVDGTQVGFCRWVTDGATFAWLCDVFVDTAHRGHGLGVFLIEVATSHPTVRGLRFLLGTGDAHGLYAKFGFTPVAAPERLMEVWKSGPPPVTGPVRAGDQGPPQ
jgi:GNAT superfamily N-acetyltransferase